MKVRVEAKEKAMPKDNQTACANWNYPTNIRFGNGRINELAKICQQNRIKHPLIITDEGLKGFEFIQQISAALDNAVIFSQIKANPNGRNITDGVTCYKHNQHDGIVAIGGGSALDAGKAIALMVGQSRCLWDFEDQGDNYLRVNTEGMAAVIAVPTTAGTGSEVGRASVIVDEINQRKKIIYHPNMLPKYVILDPQLTAGLPPNITAATGIDAFVHNFEAYCAPGYHPMADGIALQAMALIKTYLPQAYADGQNLNARGHMLSASLMGATAFQKGLGAVHALAHPLGAIYDKHHGLLNAILLPYVLRKNQTSIAEKVQNICVCLGLNPDFESFFDWIIEFRQQLGIANSLQDIGINADQSQKIAELALFDPSSAGNPIQFNTADYEEVFLNAVNGRLRKR